MILFSASWLAGCITSSTALFLPAEGVLLEAAPFQIEISSNDAVLGILNGTVLKQRGQSYYWDATQGQGAGEVMFARLPSGALIAQAKVGDYLYYLVEPIREGYRFSTVASDDLPQAARAGLNTAGIDFGNDGIGVRSRSALLALLEHARKTGKLRSATVSLSRPATPRPTVPAPLAQPGGIDRRVKFVNNTGLDITAVFASRRGVQSWGTNRLANRIGQGQSVVIDLADGSGSCNFDVQVVRSDRRHLVGLYDACATSTIDVTKDNSDDLDVEFVNRTAGTIRYLFVGGDTWRSDDLLGAGISLATDVPTRRTIKDTSGCVFYVRAVYWDESDLVIPGVNLCAMSRVEISYPKR